MRILNSVNTTITVSASASQIRVGVPAETVDGETVEFSTEEAFVEGTLQVFWNGQLLMPDQYTIGTDMQSYTLAFTPGTGDTIQHAYAMELPS